MPLQQRSHTAAPGDASALAAARATAWLHAARGDAFPAAAVAHNLLDDRPATRALVLLHSTGFPRPAIRARLPIQLHVADPDERFAPPGEVEEWTEAVTAAGAVVVVVVVVETFSYPGAGHLYTDAGLPDHHERAAALTWQCIMSLLARLDSADG